MFAEADSLASRLSLGSPGPVPSAYLALMGERDASSVTVPEATDAASRAEAHLVLHLAGAGGAHVGEAHRVLERMSSRLTGPEREDFWRFNPTARAVRAARQGALRTL